MSGAQTKQIVQRLAEEYFNVGDRGFMDEWFSPNFINHNPPAGIPSDREGLKQHADIIRSAFPDLEFTIGELIAEDQTVTAYVTASGTHQGQFWGAEPTGKSVTLPMIWIARFADGKISEWWSIWDFWQVTQRIGWVPQGQWQQWATARQGQPLRAGSVHQN